MAVPGTFACTNQSEQTVAAADDVVVAKLRAYLRWAEEDGRLAGLWPWHLTNRMHSQVAVHKTVILLTLLVRPC